MKSRLISLVRKAQNIAVRALLAAWSVIGKRYGKTSFVAERDEAIAILVHRPKGYQLAELLKRFEGQPNVFVVSWGPIAAFASKKNWLNSRANSWQSAANFAISNIRAKKLLLVGQQFDLDAEQASLLLKQPAGTCPVTLDSNGLIINAGIAADGKFVLKGFNVADLPGGNGPSAKRSAELCVVGSDLEGLKFGVCYDVRVRHFKVWQEPNGVSTGQLLEPKKELRWAIKNPAWANERGNRWGDTFFVNDLSAALKAQGQHVAEDRLQNWYRESRSFDDVELVIRGRSAYLPSGKGKSILWVISNPESVTVKEVQAFDLVFAASHSWAREMSQKSGREVKVLLQATNPSRFKPQPQNAELASEVLFVGRTRNVFREVVDFAVRAGVKLSVYGDGWKDYIDQKFIRADHLANADVPLAYSSSEIVLNDHFTQMRELGFISNRVFDAAACGARVLSDSVDGMPEIFGGLVQTYTDFDSFKKLVSDKSAWPNAKVRAELAAKVAREHSFEARAKTLD